MEAEAGIRETDKCQSDIQFDCLLEELPKGRFVAERRRRVLGPGPERARLGGEGLEG